MKKILVFICAALMLCFGCGKKENSAEKKNGSLISFDNAIYVDYAYNIYEDGYILNSDPKMYIDFETMEKTVFCTKPNCTHKSGDCVEKIVGETPVMYGD